jgi:hypothetical protein
MAFGLQYLAKIELSQNQFDQAYNAATGSASGQAAGMWTYNATALGSNDSTAAVEAANYFNGASGYLKIADMIYIACNDANHIITVTTNAAGAVTTTQLV